MSDERDAAHQKLDGIAEVLDCKSRDADLKDAICTMGGELEAARVQAEALLTLVYDLSCCLTDEGDGGWSHDGLVNIRMRVADALGKQCPEWLHPYRAATETKPQ